MGTRNRWLRRRIAGFAPACDGFTDRLPADRGGFTLLELVIVLVIGGVLAAVAIGGMGGIQARMAVRSAESSFLSMHAQARALAVERGRAVELRATPGDGLIQLREGCDGLGQILQSRNFTAEYGVTLQTSTNPLVLCMTPRGYASPTANSFSAEGRVDLVRGDDVRTVLIRPLGQAVRP